MDYILAENVASVSSINVATTFRQSFRELRCAAILASATFHLRHAVVRSHPSSQHKVFHLTRACLPQLEAAATLGLGYWQTQRKIVLPQALAMVVPSMMNNFISIFKDTSLVTIVSLYELTGALGLALNSDVEWRPFKVEAYLFITVIYFAFCFAMSRYSLWVEVQVSSSKAR